ncbi:hypothetical protein ACTFIW_007847 [Dictyostelium discoideum]
MLKQTIKKWNQSIERYESGNVGEALTILTSIEQGTSKINYNIGVMYIKSNNFRNAIEYFNRSVEQDKYLASSYYMRAIAHHMNGELNHAIVDYDETISKLRGHEYIDYKQLGLDHKLLLAEVLFNKALALGRAGSSVALQATQCFSQPSDSQEFKNQCKKIQDGSQLNFSTRPIPLSLLFKPPKVSDAPQKQRSATTSSIQSSSPSAPMSSSPPSYILKGPSSPPPPSSSSPSPSLSSSSSSPKLPPTPKPSFGSSPPSSSSSSISPLTNKTLPPKPPPLPSKKLPSRPISCVIQDVKITLKVFYKDRRLIQIPVPCNLSTFIQKIELKFEIKISDKFSLSFQLDGEENEINSQVQLDKMICMEINEINVKDIIPSSSSSPSPDKTNNSTSSYSSSSYSSSSYSSQSSSYDNKPKSSFTPKTTTRPILPPTTTTTSTSNNFNRNATLPKKFGSAPSSPSFSSSSSSSSGGPPIPTRGSPSISLLKQQNQTQSINIPPKVPTSSRPKMTQSHSPPSSSSLSSYSTSFQSVSSPSLSSSYNGSTSSYGGFSSSRPPPTPYPYQVLYTDSNEKYYLNTETNETFWELP